MRKNKVLIKQSLFLLILFGGTIIALMGIMQIRINLSNHNLVNYMVAEGNHYVKRDFNFVKGLTSFIGGFDMDHPLSILENHFVERRDNLDNLRKLTSYFDDSNSFKVNKPLIYIYNTYQLEAYTDDKKVKPNVMLASFYLRDQLQKLDVPTIVETTNLMTNLDNETYNQAPTLIRPLISDKIVKYPNLKLLIDISRDLASYATTTLRVDEEKYAKILFITNSSNSSLANTLSDKLNSLKSNLSRGVMVRDNVITSNLDLSKNMIIIKCGGKDNSIEEVNKSLNILAQLINNYIGENYGES